MNDARFEDAEDRPLVLRAETPEDIAVLSALLQDAVLPSSEISWVPRKLQFAALINRFRWEDKVAAEKAKRPYERAQATLVFQGVLKVLAQGVTPGDTDSILSILSLSFEPEADGAGRLTLVLAGDGALALEVECIDVVLRDVTRPYQAPSGQAPSHP
ncbi:MAG: DUF2948 family protein [Pseudomonadota bacterium]